MYERWSEELCVIIILRSAFMHIFSMPKNTLIPASDSFILCKSVEEQHQTKVHLKMFRVNQRTVPVTSEQPHQKSKEKVSQPALVHVTLKVLKAG